MFICEIQRKSNDKKEGPEFVITTIENSDFRAAANTAGAAWSLVQQKANEILPEDKRTKKLSFFLCYPHTQKNKTNFIFYFF